MPRPKKGEKTPGSGMQKGYKAPQTLEKEAARELVRQLVTQELEPMTLAQIANAKGVSYVMLRHPDGSFTIADDEKQLKAAAAAGAQSFEIFTRQPNTTAFTDLLNRALDKPKDQPLDVSVVHGLDQKLLDLLQKGRDRAGD